MMEDYIFYIITFVAGLYAGWWIRELIALYLVRKALDSITIHAPNRPAAIPITVELDNDRIYVYDRATSEFMASASTFQEVESILSEKYPGKLFSASTEDLLKLNK